MIFQSNNTEGLFYSLLTPSTADWLHVPGPVCYKEIHEDGDVGHTMMEHVDGGNLYLSFPLILSLFFFFFLKFLKSIFKPMLKSSRHLLRLP